MRIAEKDVPACGTGCPNFCGSLQRHNGKTSIVLFCMAKAEPLNANTQMAEEFPKMCPLREETAKQSANR